MDQVEENQKVAASSRSEEGAKDQEEVVEKGQGRKSVGQSANSGGRDKSSESEQP